MSNKNKTDYLIYKANAFAQMQKDRHPLCHALAAEEQEQYYLPKAVAQLHIEWEKCRTTWQKQNFCNERKYTFQTFIDRLFDLGESNNLYQLYFHPLNNLQCEIVRFQTSDLDIKKLFNPKKPNHGHRR